MRRKDWIVTIAIENSSPSVFYYTVCVQCADQVETSATREKNRRQVHHQAAGGYDVGLI